MAAREQEQLSGKMVRVHYGATKCPIGQISRGTPARQFGPIPPKCQTTLPPYPQTAEYRYYQKMGHNINECRMINNLWWCVDQASIGSAISPPIDQFWEK